MRIEVLAFGAAADAFGARMKSLTLHEGARVADLLAQLAAESTALARILAACAVAVQEEYATPETILHDGDTVALIPPVSGGSVPGIVGGESAGGGAGTSGAGAGGEGAPGAGGEGAHGAGREGAGRAPAEPPLLTEAPLSMDALVRRVAHRNAGAIATFTGTVRATTRAPGRIAQEVAGKAAPAADRAAGEAPVETPDGATRASTPGGQAQTLPDPAVLETVRLHYEAYAGMAEKELAKIAAAAEQRWPGARVALVHRVGELEPGQPSVMVAVSTPHRADAFAACRFCIDTLKQTVPIWKKEIRPDGTEEWSNRP